MTDDPFDAQHPDNVPAFYDDLGAIQQAIVWDTRWGAPDWNTHYEIAHRYPIEAGWDPRTDRLRIPITYWDWQDARRHPTWPDYLDEMNARPAGQVIGFADWLNSRARTDSGFGAHVPDPDVPRRDVVVDGPGNSPGTRAANADGRPFLCDPETPLPPGWVRGDPASHSGPTQRLAYDPARHTVVRCTGTISAATSGYLAQAGFEPLPVPGEGVTFYVADRFAQRRSTSLTRPVPARCSGRSL